MSSPVASSRSKTPSPKVSPSRSFASVVKGDIDLDMEFPEITPNPSPVMSPVKSGKNQQDRKSEKDIHDFPVYKLGSTDQLTGLQATNVAAFLLDKAPYDSMNDRVLFVPLPTLHSKDVRACLPKIAKKLVERCDSVNDEKKSMNSFVRVIGCMTVALGSHFCPFAISITMKAWRQRKHMELMVWETLSEHPVKFIQPYSHE